ncbi:MAG: flagellar FliJ family protein [Rhodospirillaceae bacterium]
MAKKPLHNLIRLRKWDVDEKRRTLATLLRHEEAVIERQKALEAEIRAEVEFANTAPVELRGTLPGYLRLSDEKRGRLADALREVQARVAYAQEELAEAYRRSKTLEVTQANRDKAEQLEDNRREEIDLNEVGLNLFRRRVALETN